MSSQRSDSQRLEIAKERIRHVRRELKETRSDCNTRVFGKRGLERRREVLSGYVFLTFQHPLFEVGEKWHGYYTHVSKFDSDVEDKMLMTSVPGFDDVRIVRKKKYMSN